MDILTFKAGGQEEARFAEVVGLIAAAWQRAFQAVNYTLIDLYWQGFDVSNLRHMRVFYQAFPIRDALLLN